MTGTPPVDVDERQLADMVAGSRDAEAATAAKHHLLAEQHTSRARHHQQQAQHHADWLEANGCGAGHHPRAEHEGDL